MCQQHSTFLSNEFSISPSNTFQTLILITSSIFRHRVNILPACQEPSTVFAIFGSIAASAQSPGRNRSDFTLESTKTIQIRKQSLVVFPSIVRRKEIQTHYSTRAPGISHPAEGTQDLAYLICTQKSPQ